MEDLQHQFSIDERVVKLNYIGAFEMEEGIKDVLEFIGEQVELAYLAGYNKINLSESQPQVVEITGYPLTLARCYAKDKGFKL